MDYRLHKHSSNYWANYWLKCLNWNIDRVCSFSATGSGTQGINKVGCWDIKGMLPNNWHFLQVEAAAVALGTHGVQHISVCTSWTKWPKFFKISIFTSFWSPVPKYVHTPFNPHFISSQIIASVTCFLHGKVLSHMTFLHTIWSRLCLVR